MKPKLILTAALLIGSIIPAFSQENQLVKYVPEKANMVIAINPVSLLTKISGESFRQSILYRELMKNPTSPIRTILNDPSTTGIDFISGILIFSTPGDGNEDHPNKPRMSVLGAIAQPERFTKFMTDMGGEDLKILTEGNEKMVVNGKGCLAWNEKTFVFTGSADDHDYSNYPEDTSTAAIEAWAKMRKEKTIQRSKSLLHELLTPKNQNGFSGNALFAQFMARPADLKAWSNGEGDAAQMKFLPIGKLLSELKAYTAGTKLTYVNFEKGKIVAESQNYLQGGLGEAYKKYPPLPQNQALLKKLPKGTVLGMFNASYNTAMGKEFMNMKIFRELLDSAGKYVNFDFSKLPGVFKDNMMLAVVQTDEKENKKEGIQVILAMPIADVAKYNELSRSVKHFYDSVKATEEGAKMFKKFEPVVKNNDGYFVLSLSERTATDFLANPGTQPLPGGYDAYSRYPFYAQANLREIIKTVILNSKGSEKDKAGLTEMLLNSFDQFIVYGGEYKNESLRSTIELSMVDKDKNSLQQFFDLATNVAEKMSEARSDRKEETDAMNDEKKVDEVKIVEIIQESDNVPPPPPPPPPKEINDGKKKPVKKKKS